MYGVASVLSIIKTLVSPYDTLNQSDDTSGENSGHNRFEECLISCLSKAESKLSDKSFDHLRIALNINSSATAKSNDVIWRYVELCLNLLRCLKESMDCAIQHFKKNLERHTLNPSPLPPDMLSITNQQNIATMLQLVTCLGIYPHLRKGVGIPIEKRSKFGKLIHITMDTSISFSGKNDRLFACVKVLLDCSCHPTFGCLIITKHLHDLLAVILQLLYAPPLKLKKKIENLNPKIDASPTDVTDSNQGMKGLFPEVVDVSAEIKRECQKYLDELKEKVYQPLLIRELMILIGSPLNKSHCMTSISPTWLRKVCLQLLSDCLMKPNGILTIIQELMENISDNSPVWQIYEAIGKFVAMYPVQSIEDYYKIISPQILDLFSIADENINFQIQLVACSIINAMFIKNPTITRQFVMTPMLHPFLICLQEQSVLIDDKGEPVVIVSEINLNTCVANLHKFLVAGSDPNNLLLLELQLIIHPLFQLFCFCKSNACFLRSMVYDLLLRYLKHVDEKDALTGLNIMAFDKVKSTTLKLMDNSLYFAPGDDGGAVIIQKCSEDGENWTYKMLQLDCLIELLKDLEKEELPGVFFLHLCYELSDIGISAITNTSDELPTASGQELMHLESQFKKFEYNMHLLTLVENLSENIGPSLLRNTKQILQFIKVTLERAAELYSKAKVEYDADNLKMILGLLATLLMDKSTVFPTEKETVLSLIPLLDIIIYKYSHSEINEMASDIKTSIITYGGVSPKKNKENHISKSNLSNTSSVPDPSLSSKKMDPNISEFKQAWQDLSDPLIPVQGHSLIILHRLLLAKNPEAVANKEQLLVVFQEYINHEDSYIYLAAIQGMASLADSYPDVALEIITNQYAEFDSKRRSPDLRMKLGEVLVKTVSKLGEIATRYFKKLIAAFLCGTKDPDAYIRASSLSNLGEICKLLHFDVGTFQHELLSCLSSIVKSDPAPEARRAAILVVTLLLRGLGEHVLKVLESTLKDLYHLLKLVYQTDKDDGVKLHVQLALDELNIIMRNFIFPQQTIEHKIKILDIDY